MARIIHPRPQAGRVTDRIGSVEFVDGFAEVDLSDKPHLRDSFVQHGYSIEEPPAVDTFAEAESEGEAYIPPKRSHRKKA